MYYNTQRLYSASSQYKCFVSKYISAMFFCIIFCRSICVSFKTRIIFAETLKSSMVFMVNCGHWGVYDELWPLSCLWWTGPNWIQSKQNYFALRDRLHDLHFLWNWGTKISTEILSYALTLTRKSRSFFSNQGSAVQGLQGAMIAQEAEYQCKLPFVKQCSTARQ